MGGYATGFAGEGVGVAIRDSYVQEFLDGLVGDGLGVGPGLANVVQNGEGDDVIIGGSGDDQTFGDDGNDMFIGGQSSLAASP